MLCVYFGIDDRSQLCFVVSTELTQKMTLKANMIYFMHSILFPDYFSQKVNKKTEIFSTDR